MNFPNTAALNQKHLRPTEQLGSRQNPEPHGVTLPAEGAGDALPAPRTTVAALDLPLPQTHLRGKDQAPSKAKMK